MKLEYIIYDIKELLLALKDDTRVKDSYLIHKIINYDCLLKEQMVLQGIPIPEQCFSRLPKREVHEVTTGDHPDITVSSIKLGKVDYPKLINVPDLDKALRVTSSSRQAQLYRTTFPYLMHLIRSNDSRLQLFHYYVPYGTGLYIYRFLPELDIMALLEDPTDAYQVYSELFSVDQLQVGIEYVVLTGAVTEMIGTVPTVYKKFDSFICQADYTYSGDGKVQKESAIHQITLQDDYPITRAMAQQIVIQILTRDYQIEKQAIPDIYNDAMDDDLTARLKLKRTWSAPRTYAQDSNMRV